MKATKKTSLFALSIIALSLGQTAAALEGQKPFVGCWEGAAAAKETREEGPDTFSICKRFRLDISATNETDYAFSTRCLDEPDPSRPSFISKGEAKVKGKVMEGGYHNFDGAYGFYAYMYGSGAGDSIESIRYEETSGNDEGYRGRVDSVSLLPVSCQ